MLRLVDLFSSNHITFLDPNLIAGCGKYSQSGKYDAGSKWCCTRTGKRGTGDQFLHYCAQPRVKSVPAPTQQQQPLSSATSCCPCPAWKWCTHTYCDRADGRLSDPGLPDPDEAAAACGRPGCKRDDGDQRLEWCTLQSPHSLQPFW